MMMNVGRKTKIAGTALVVAVVTLIGFQNCSRFASDMTNVSSVASVGTGTSGGTSPSGPVDPPTDVPPVVSPRVTYYGRYEALPGADYFGKTYGVDVNKVRVTWSGSAVRARFTGPSLRVALASKKTDSRYNVYYLAKIDDQDPVRFEIAEAPQVYLIAAELSADAVHTVLLMRESEGQLGTSDFLGFDFGVNGKLESPFADLGLQLEFIGDSITCGYGNLDQNCSFTSATESAYSSYAQATVRELQTSAPATQICHSGMGATRFSAQAQTDGKQMPYEYKYQHTPIAVASENLRLWTFPTAVAKQPNYVIVNLGTNDFWDGTEPAAFRNDYRSIVNFVRLKYPETFIIATVGSMTDLPAAAVQDVVTKAQATDDRVAYLALPLIDRAADGLGCDGHPTSKTHQKMAQRLASEIRNIETMRAIYVNLLEREPDPAGLQYYLQKLRNGALQGQIEDEIKTTPEYKKLHP